MKEEELIKKLKDVDLPEIELPSHRRWLRVALLTAGYPESQPDIHVRDSVKSGIKVGIDIITKGLASRQPTWKVALIIICAVVLAAVGSWVFFGQDRTYAGALIEQSRLETEALVSALSPGKTLYMKKQIYQRHGPAAPRIMEGSWYIPESSYGDQWMRVDSDGNFYCFQSMVTDSDGNVWQESMTVDGEQLIRNPRSGEEVWSPWRPYPVTQYLESVLSLPEKLLDRGWEFVGNGKWDDGRQTAVFEKYDSFVNQGTNLEHGYVIPWVADLNAVAMIFRFEIVIDNPLFYSEEIWVANAAGERTMVEQHRRVIVEVLDDPPPLAPCPPPYVVRTFTLSDADEVLDLGPLLSDRFERIDAASEGLSSEDLGLGAEWSKVYLYRSNDTDELVYAYLTIMTESADEQARTEVIEGMKAGAPSDFHRSIFGTDVIENELAEFIRNPHGSSYGTPYSSDNWEYGSVRVGRVFVVIYRVSMYSDREPLAPIVQEIWRRLGKFDQ